MKREEQKELPGSEISGEFIRATEMVINIASDLKKIDRLIQSDSLDAEEKRSLANLWNNLTD